MEKEHMQGDVASVWAVLPRTPWKGLDKSVSTVPGCSSRAQIFCFLRVSSFTFGKPDKPSLSQVT